MKRFGSEFTSYWRAPSDVALKLVVIIGLLLHVSFLLSLQTGWWDTWFHDSVPTVHKRGTDFFAIYVSAHELVRGRTIYPVENLPDYQDFVKNLPEEQKTRWKISGEPQTDYSKIVPYFDPYRYLPVAVLVGIPFSLMKPWVAYWTWIVVYEILFFGCILMLGHRFGTMRKLHVAAALYLFFTPWYPEIYLGQFSFMQSFLILGSIVPIGGEACHGGRYWVASVLWKINTIICLPSVIKWRLWTPIKWLVIILVVTSVPYFIWHPADFLKFFMINFRAPGPADSGNFGFLGLISKIFMGVNNGEDTPARLAVQYISIVVFILIGLWATFRAQRYRFAQSVCMWIAMYFLIYSDVWEHQYVMLLPLIAFLYLRRPTLALWIIWFLLAAPTTYKIFYDILHASMLAGNPVDMIKDTSFLNDWHFTLIKPMSVLAFWIYCVYETLRPSSGRHDKDGVPTG